MRVTKNRSVITATTVQIGAKRRKQNILVLIDFEIHDHGNASIISIYKFAVHFSLARVNITDTRTTDNKASWVVRRKLVHTSASKIRHQLAVPELIEQIYR